MDGTKGSEIGHQYPQNWSLSWESHPLFFWSTALSCTQTSHHTIIYYNIYIIIYIYNILIYHLIPCKHSKIWCSWALECVYHYFSWILTASTSETWVSMGSKHHFSMETTFAKNIRWPARCDAESFGGGDIPRILLKHQFMNRGFTCFFVCKMYLFFTMMNWGQATKQKFVRV